MEHIKEDTSKISHLRTPCTTYCFIGCNKSDGELFRVKYYKKWTFNLCDFHEKFQLTRSVVWRHYAKNAVGALGNS